MLVKRNRATAVCGNSGDPADIICGTKPDSKGNTTEGVIELLWNIFGGETNDKGYKVLHPCIGAIYGDAITIDRCRDICKRLEEKGFASTNIVFGIGSYTYQYITRDSLGFAMKSTSVIIDGIETPIFKNPATDNGVKKSARGRVKVIETGEGLKCSDLDNTLNGKDILRDVFCDGDFFNEERFEDIRERFLKM